MSSSRCTSSLSIPSSRPDSLSYTAFELTSTLPSFLTIASSSSPPPPKPNASPNVSFLLPPPSKPAPSYLSNGPPAVATSRTGRSSSRRVPR